MQNPQELPAQVPLRGTLVTILLGTAVFCQWTMEMELTTRASWLGRCVTPTILYTGLDAWWQWGMEKDALHLLPGLRALNHVNTPMGLG